MNKRHTAQSAFFNSRIVITLLLCAIAACSLVSRPLLAFFRPEASTKDSQRTLTFPQRVAYQRAIEEVYWRHRIWPNERLDPKPSLDAVMSQARSKTKSQITANHKRSQITGNGQLLLSSCKLRWIAWQEHRAARCVTRTLCSARQRPCFIAECLARPALAERLPRMERRSN